jgi:hypothetical protein
MYVAEATILFAGAFEPEEARLTESNIYKDGSMIIRLDNATTIKLCRNFLHPSVYLEMVRYTIWIRQSWL